MPVATCPLCEAACGIVVETSGERITSVRGDVDDPFSRGYICPKAAALPDLHDDPDRLRAPVVRDGRKWRDVSWGEALDVAAEGLRRIRKRCGRDALGIYWGNPLAHNLGLMTHALPFARALRTRNAYSASSADQIPEMMAALAMFGHSALLPVPDLDRTLLFVIFGANPLVSNGSLMTAPNMGKRIRDIQTRGGHVIVVDPRRTETADAADEHIPVRPGTDALLLAAILHVVFVEQLSTPRSLDGRLKHLDELRAVVEPLSPERVARRTGVDPDTTRRLARRIARTPRAACYGRVGICTQRYGSLAAWLLLALDIVTGHLDEIGGMMFTTPAVDVFGIMRRLRMLGSYDRWRSRVRQLPEFGGEFPVATLADEILTPGDGQIRGLITVAGNPVLSAPQGAKLDRAMSTLEHVVAIDTCINETTRHAHVILPPAPPLSRGHYDLALNAFSIRNVAKYVPPVVPAGLERQDWEIVSDLAVRLFVPRPLRSFAAGAARRLTPERLLDVALRRGPYGLTLDALRRHPHGLDLGALQPGRLPASIATTDGCIDLAPPRFADEARRELPADADRNREPLVLIGRRQLRSNNSWMHNSERLVKGKPRCTLLMHPEDAAARCVRDGDAVRLQSGAGKVTVPVEITDGIIPGVVSLPHGWGHTRDGVRQSVAREHAGASVNDVTSAEWLDTLSGTAAFNGVPVEVSKVTERTD